MTESIFDTLDLDRNKTTFDQLESKRNQTASLGLEVNNTPVTAQTVQDVEPKSNEEDVVPLSLSEGFGYALEHETLMGFGYKLANMPDFEPDPDLYLTAEYFEENFSDIPSDLHSYLYEGESEAEIQHRADLLRERIETEAQFSAMDPASQIGVLLGASLVDAPSLALSALSGAGGVAALTKLGLTGSRIARIAGGALGVGAEAAIHEAILSSQDPLKNEKTVLLAGLTGFGFGAAGGEISHRMIQKNIRKAALKDQQALTDEIIRDAAQEVAGTKNIQTDFKASSMTPLDRLYKDIPDVEDEALRKIGIDMTSQLKRSKDEGFQKLGNILGEDGIFGGGPTMALEFDTTTRPVMADGLKGVNDAYKQWAKDSGIGLTGRIGHKGREQFNEKIALLVRGIGSPETDAETAGVNAVRKYFKDMLDVAKNSGLKGFEDIDESMKYLTRTYSSSKFHKITQQYGTNSKDIIIRTLKGAIQNGDNNFGDEIADKIALGIYNRSMSTKLKPDQKFTTVLTNSFKGELESILEAADLGPEEIKSMMTKITTKGDSGLAQAKRRINMAEGYIEPVTGLRLTDLLENNVEQLMVRYGRTVGGASAAAKFGFNSPQALLNHISNTADKAVKNGRLDPDAAIVMRRKATNLANQILGHPNEEFTTFNKLGQLLMDYEYVRTSGGFALASIPEMLITTAENGFRTTLQHVPIAKKFINSARKNVKPNEDLLTLIESWGVGRDMDMMNAFVRIAEDDALSETMNRGVKALNVGKRVAGLASGLPQLTRFSQLLAGRSTIQKFTDMAYSGKPVKVKKWLKQLGLNDEQQINNMFKGLKKFSKTQDGIITGRKVVGLDFDGWMNEDPAAATQFMYAVARRVNHQIQRNLPGETPEFMSKTWGKLITQFKTFGIAAYGKKTLNALHRRDVESVVAVGLTTTAASMIYATRMYAVAQTRDDPEAFLEERLSTENLVKAAIQRSGFASILPAMIDNGLALFQQDRVFNDYARTSGLDVGGPESVPSIQTGLNAAKTIGNIGNTLIGGEEFQEKDARAAFDMLPFRRLPGINEAYETLINTFPERGVEK